MTGLWMLTAVVCAAEAIWLKQWRPVRVPSDLAPAENAGTSSAVDIGDAQRRHPTGIFHSPCADCRGRYCGRRIRRGTAVGRRAIERRCFLG